MLPGKYPNQYIRRTLRGSWMMIQPDWCMGTKKMSQFDWPTGDTSGHGKQISVHEGACSCNRLVQQICPGLELAPSYQSSLIWGSKTRRFCCATYFFATNRLYRRRSFAPGMCYRRAAGASPLVCTGLYSHWEWSQRYMFYIHRWKYHRGFYWYVSINLVSMRFDKGSGKASFEFITWPTREYFPDLNTWFATD